MVVGGLMSFWNGPFSGATLKVGVYIKPLAILLFLIFGMLNIFFFARCRLVIGKLKSRGDGKSSSSFAVSSSCGFLDQLWYKRRCQNWRTCVRTADAIIPFNQPLLKTSLRAITVVHCSTSGFFLSLIKSCWMEIIVVHLNTITYGKWIEMVRISRTSHHIISTYRHFG